MLGVGAHKTATSAVRAAPHLRYPGRVNRRVVFVLGLAALVALLVLRLLLGGQPEPGRAPGRALAPAPGAAPVVAPVVAGSASAPPAPERAALTSEAELIAAAAAQAPRYPVDLEWLRGKLPGNLYWELGAPTSDPEVAKARAERAKRSNDAYGRVLSGEATEAEVREYYADKRKVSQDYLELALLVIAEKGAELPERDRGMFELSAKMHRDRLAQIERDLADALARRAAR